MNLLDEEIICLKNWADGKKASPSRIQVEPTFKCNLKCIYCGRHSKKFDYKSELPDEKWKSIGKDIADIGFKSVILSGEGEIFCEPKRTLELAALFKKNNLNGSMITNGTLLNEKIIETLVRIKWDDMVISIDGSKAEIHDRLSQIKGSFGRVLKNLYLIKKYKKKYNTVYPELCFITVVTNRNYRDFPNIIKLAKDVNCRKITFMPLFNSENIESHSFLKISDSEYASLVNVMADVKKLAEEYNIETNSDHVLERLKPFYNDKIKTKDNIKTIIKTSKSDLKKIDSKDKNKKEGKEQKPWEPCYQPWLTMTLAADGVCRACCFLHDIKDSVQDKSLNEVWFGPIFNKLRERVYNQGSVPGCESCAEPVILRNKQLERELKKRKISFKVS